MRKTMTTLEIRVGERERTRRETLERIEAAQQGEEVEERHVLNIERERDVTRVLSEVNLELIRTIAEHEPTSMRETADLVDRDFKEVHGNLTELESLGLIKFVEEGRAKRPIVPYDEIHMDIDLSGPDHETGRNHAVA